MKQLTKNLLATVALTGAFLMVVGPVLADPLDLPYTKAVITFPDGFEVVVPSEGDICVYDAVYCPRGFLEDGTFPHVNQAEFIRAVIGNQNRVIEALSEHYCGTVTFGPLLIDCDER